MSRIIIFAQSALRDTVITKIIIIKCQEYVRTSCCPWCSQGPQIKLFGCLVGSQRWSAWTATKLFLCFVFRSATLVSMGPRLNYLGILFSAILVSMGLRWKCSGTSFSVAVVDRDPRRIYIFEHSFCQSTITLFSPKLPTTRLRTSLLLMRPQQEKNLKCDPSKRVLICLCGHYSLLTSVTEKIINTADYTSYAVFISCLKTAPYSVFISCLETVHPHKMKFSHLELWAIGLVTI